MTYMMHILTQILLVMYLEIMFDPLRAEALWNHHNSSLHIEAQRHLGTALIVLLSNRCEKLILQQRRTFHIDPNQIGSREGESFTLAFEIHTLPARSLDTPSHSMMLRPNSWLVVYR